MIHAYLLQLREAYLAAAVLVHAAENFPQLLLVVHLVCHCEWSVRLTEKGVQGMTTESFGKL